MTTKETTNLDLYNAVRVVPEEAKKKISGGRLSGFTDISPMWRIKELTNQFGVCGFGWRYEILEQRLEAGIDKEIKAFVTINLFIKKNGAWSEAIPGIGGSSFVTVEKHGVYVSDECFKMALTDAIGVACKSLGFGADVYFEKDKSKYPTDSSSTGNSPATTNQRNPKSGAQQKPPATNNTKLPELQKLQKLLAEMTLKDGYDAAELKADMMEQCNGKATTNDLTKKEATKFYQFLMKLREA